MELNKDDIEGLNIALEEAILGGAELDTTTERVGITLIVLSLPEEGPPPSDPRVQFVFTGVSRLAAHLINGRWDDLEAEAIRFQNKQLLEIVQSFGQLPIYGWDFFNAESDCEKRWGKRISFDWRSEKYNNKNNTITLFQEGNKRFLEFRVWFDSFIIKDPLGNEINLSDFIEGGKRWWDGLYKGDPRTKDKGIFPL